MDTDGNALDKLTDNRSRGKAKYLLMIVRLMLSTGFVWGWSANIPITNIEITIILKNIDSKLSLLKNVQAMTFLLSGEVK